MTLHQSIALALAALGSIAASAPSAHAASSDRQRYDLPAQSLAASLRAVALQSGRNVLADASIVADRQAPALKGSFTVEEALDLLLAGTGLRPRAAGTSIIIEPAVGEVPPPTPDILVTGTRIRGAKVASPVITVTREGARDAGQATLGEIVRSIPQSFGGGQNPGIGFNVPSSSGADSGGGSTINLRGLGSDATLTLLNGHRLSYGGTRQAVDVSAIPLGAVDRIEIVADGASALYGSDAVGGVANIILRPDMTGVETRARIGGATEGGDFSQQYGVAAGSRWGSGGIIAAYEFNRTGAIDWNQRDYAIDRSIGLRLLPSARNHNVLLSGHQSFGGGFAFAIDGLYNDRSTFFTYPLNVAGDRAVSRIDQSTNQRSFAIAPSLSWSSGSALKIELAGSYAEDRLDYRSTYFEPGFSAEVANGCYCNSGLSVELSGDAKLFSLPGGAAKLALGAGYRRAGLRSFRGAGDFQNFNGSTSSKYGYAELSLPILSPAGPDGGSTALNLDAAVRYERYRSFGSIATPKIALIWGPSRDVDLKASWGRSFRAPTLYQRFQASVVTLDPVTTLGGSGYPADATVLFTQGGGPGLRPERATTWSATLSVHPVAVRGLSLDLSYYSVRYVDRIVMPITFAAKALSDPLYARFVTRSPSVAEIEAIVANAGLFEPDDGLVYDPAKVVAIVSNDNVNAGHQSAHGIDILASYAFDVGSRDHVSVSANASYLASSRQFSVDEAKAELAGFIFNPPHWRGRGTIGWTHRTLTVTSALSYTGRLVDPRFTPSQHIPGQATVDLALRYRTPDAAPRAFRGLDLILSVQNILDTPPPPIAIRAVTDAPYDSTNYSAIGRFVSLSIAKKW
jgi:outer membrane receptor protein involved in Fe transport